MSLFSKIWIEENGEKKIEIAWSELSADEETVILGAIENYWEILNKQIDDVFAGKKGSTDFVRGLPTQKLLAKYRRATVHYSK